MTFASRMQHKIYWGPMKKPIEWSLKTVLAPWAYIASVIYHDSFWYPVNAKRMMRDVLDEPVGPAVPQLGDGAGGRERLPGRRRRTPRRSSKTGGKALLESLGILGTCIKEAPEFAEPQAARQDKLTARLKAEVRKLTSCICLISASKRQRRRRADHAADPRRGSARSAASTTPKKRSASWPTSSSRSSSIPSGVRSDLLEQYRKAPRRRRPPRELRVRGHHALRVAPRLRRAGCASCCSRS